MADRQNRTEPGQGEEQAADLNPDRTDGSDVVGGSAGRSGGGSDVVGSSSDLGPDPGAAPTQPVGGEVY